MDKASDYESGDSRFESWWGRFFFLRGRDKMHSNNLIKATVDTLLLFMYFYDVVWPLKLKLRRTGKLVRG